LAPSTINWTNRGQTSDNFATVFGSSAAATARSVVDTAINEWQSVISNFNQVNHGDNNHIDVTISMNTAAGSTGGSTNATAWDPNGKPTSATITLGRTGDGTNPWFLDPTLFSSAFLGTSTNAYSGYAQAGSPAAGKQDLMEVVTHELGHAMGFYSGTQINAHSTDTGVVDTTSIPINPMDPTRGHYHAFVGTGGFRCLLTSFNTTAGGGGQDTHGGEHSAAGGSLTFGGNQYNGADDLMTPYYGSSQRRIVSRNDAFVLRDSYGYTVNDPATALGTYYAVKDNTGRLLIRGRLNAASGDTITIDTHQLDGVTFTDVSVRIGTPAAGTETSPSPVYASSFSGVQTIQVQTGNGGTFDVVSTPFNVPALLQSSGHATVNLGSTNAVLYGAAYRIQGPVTISAPSNSTTVNVDDQNDPSFRTVTVDTVTPVGDTAHERISGLTGGVIDFRGSAVTFADVITGRSGATINVLGTACYTDLLENASGAVNVGNGGRVQGIGGPVEIRNIGGGSSRTTVTVDDSADASTRVGTHATFGSYDQVSGLSPANIFYLAAETASATIKTGISGSTLNVTGTTVPLSVIGNGSSVVNIGNGSVAGIGAIVSVSNPPANAYTALVVNDSADMAGHNVTVSESSITGLAPAAINYLQRDLGSLTVRGGMVASTFTVTNTPNGGAPGGLLTMLNSGSGNGSTVNVRATTGPLAINLQNTLSTVNIGSTAHNLANLAGLVAIHGQGGTALNLNDQSTTSRQQYNILDSRIDWAPYGATLATHVQYDGLTNLTLNGASGPGNSLGVSRTAAGTTTVVNGNGGSDSFLVWEDGPGILDGMRGPLQMHSQGASNTLELYDGGNTTGHTYRLSAVEATNRLERFDGQGNPDLAPITWDGQGSETLYTPSQTANVINVVGNSPRIVTQFTANASDTVNIGQGDLSAVQGEVIVTAGGAVQVNVDDSGDPTPRQATFHTDYVFPYLTGLAPGSIYFNLDPAASVSVKGGSGGNVFRMDGAASFALSINGGTGADTLDYSAYTGNVIVDLQAGFATGIAGGLSGNFVSVHGANSSGDGLYNLLIGTGGNVLTGGTGRRNILVAGGTASTLNGGTQDDLLIGGTATYDTEAGLVLWQAIAAYWAGTDDYNTRVTNVETGNGVPLLDATTVTGNGGGNTMNGLGALALIYTDGNDTIIGFDPGSQQYLITP
jgi:hypothetical protein